jgi:hypothetical protein
LLDPVASILARCVLYSTVPSTHTTTHENCQSITWIQQLASGPVYASKFNSPSDPPTTRPQATVSLVPQPQTYRPFALPLPTLRAHRSLRHTSSSLPLNPHTSLRSQHNQLPTSPFAGARNWCYLPGQLPSIISVSRTVRSFPALCDVLSPRWASPSSRYSMTVRTPREHKQRP